ncbi:MAG TPA: TPM domain-containing protein [Ignavibacteriales bacterium]|nr:TPM domain-containing protein [Ignavibacteriales bacterium]HOM66058.1 TPM domain-containing protein [Ignavibacteriales bacterium]HPD67550.1 TPM domain-containing protein [Ignavibacteriales bacterium]HRR19306.1 TPM domain-containing protein [Ignavibacteriales bacterium]HRT99068.1 TPM domain-containing protein [Ignavibacteriales bacterium]
MKKSTITPEQEKQIINKISEIESKTSAEIKIIIKNKKGFFEKRKSCYQIAVKEFYKNKLHLTKDRTGVLLLILLKEHEVTILGDAGINSKIEPNFWDNVINDIIPFFKENNLAEGIIKALEDISEPLITYFPIQENDQNELSNDIIIK